MNKKPYIKHQYDGTDFTKTDLINSHKQDKCELERLCWTLPFN